MMFSPFFFTARFQPDQTFPSPEIVSLTETSFTTNTTAHNVAFPAAVEAGSLLLLIWSNDGTATVTTPTGFTSIYNLSGTARSNAFKKVAVGTEGGTTIGVTTSATEQAAAQMYNITNWHGVIGGCVGSGTITTNSGTTRSTPTLTTGFGTVNTLWIVAAHASATQTVTALPASFTDLTTTGTAATTGARVYSGRRLLTADSLTPGNLTISASTTVVFTRATIGIRGVL